MFTAGHIEPWLTSHDSDSEVQQRRGLYRISQCVCVCVRLCLRVCVCVCGPLWPLLPHIVSKNKIGFCSGLRSVCVCPQWSAYVWGGVYWEKHTTGFGALVRPWRFCAPDNLRHISARQQPPWHRDRADLHGHTEPQRREQQRRRSKCTLSFILGLSKLYEKETFSQFSTRKA